MILKYYQPEVRMGPRGSSEPGSISQPALGVSDGFMEVSFRSTRDTDVVLLLIQMEFIFQGCCVIAYAVVSPFSQPSFPLFPSFLSILFCFIFPMMTTLAEDLVISVGDYKWSLKDCSLSCPFLPSAARHMPSGASFQAQIWSCMPLSRK